MFQPFGNATGTSAPPAAWHPEPNLRGTFSVLSTCLFTLSLSVWTAVHLNLPEHKKAHRQVWRKLGWVGWGLLAPELVAWNAWEQRCEVKSLTKHMQDLHYRRYHIPSAKPTTWKDRFRPRRLDFRRDSLRVWQNIKVALLIQPGELEETKQDHWPNLHEKATEDFTGTDLHSWYALMGGFAFDTTSAEQPILPRECERVVITVEGIKLLATYWPHLIPPISKEDIEDKSKSDGFAKLITCWQATWFCLQRVYRICQGLSVSLLELNVFGHAICALFIYIVWWNKPKDIQEPTKLMGDTCNRVAALLITLSPPGIVQAYGYREDLLLPFDLLSWMASKSTILNRMGVGIQFLDKECVANLMWTPSEEHPDSRCLPEFLPLAHYHLEEAMHPRSVLIGNAYWTLRRSNEFAPFRLCSDIWIEIDTITAARHKIICHFNELREIVNKHLILVKGIDEPCLSAPAFIGSRKPDWQVDYKTMDRLLNQPLYLIGATFASVLYGGLHATAWNAAYPTYFEQASWRFSCVMVAGALLAVSLLTFTLLLIGMFLNALLPRGWWGRLEQSISEHSWLILVVGSTWRAIGLCCAMYLVSYVVCRIFLVVESFINVAHLSRTDLRLPNWPQYVPHVT